MSKNLPFNLEDSLFSLLQSNTQTALQSILDLNPSTKKFGVSLTKEESLLLLNARASSLKEQERIEFGEGILAKLIFSFCDSPYIYQDNYVDTLERLQDIFYLYKNECMDELTDDELVAFIKTNFNGICQGSLDYLEDTCLEGFAREIRSGTRRFIGLYTEDDDEY
ncbi:MAG: DUF6323 family protein [Velocimicrobium sp.]